jgi:hypothetical protein
MFAGSIETWFTLAFEFASLWYEQTMRVFITANIRGDHFAGIPTIGFARL